MSVMDLFRLDGKVVIVTGASSGLGVAFAHCSGSATSVATVCTRRPVERTESATRSSLSTRRAPSTTSAPASAKQWANATPRPLEAPVTMTTLPSRRKRSMTLMVATLGRGARHLCHRGRWC